MELSPLSRSFLITQSDETPFKFDKWAPFSPAAFRSLPSQFAAFWKKIKKSKAETLDESSFVGGSSKDATKGNIY